MVTANWPPVPIIWSRPRAGATWHARRSHLDAAALCRYAARTGWVGVREAEPAVGAACRVCLVRARAVLAASRSPAVSGAAGERPRVGRVAAGSRAPRRGSDPREGTAPAYADRAGNRA